MNGFAPINDAKSEKYGNIFPAFGAFQKYPKNVVWLSTSVVNKQKMLFGIFDFSLILISIGVNDQKNNFVPRE